MTAHGRDHIIKSFRLVYIDTGPHISINPRQGKLCAQMLSSPDGGILKPSLTPQHKFHPTTYKIMIQI